MVVRIDRPYWRWLNPFVAGHRGDRAHFPTDLRSQSCGLTSPGATAQAKARAVTKPPLAGQFSNRAPRKSVAFLQFRSIRLPPPIDRRVISVATAQLNVLI